MPAKFYDHTLVQVSSPTLKEIEVAVEDGHLSNRKGYQLLGNKNNYFYHQHLFSAFLWLICKW